MFSLRKHFYKQLLYLHVYKMLIQRRGQQPNLFFKRVSQAWPIFESQNLTPFFLFAFHSGLASPSFSKYCHRRNALCLLQILLLFIDNPCIIDCRKSLRRLSYSPVTITGVMSTFTASGELSMLFKVTWRIYLWLHPHYPRLHLLFDPLSSVYMQDMTTMSCVSHLKMWCEWFQQLQNCE